GEGSTRSGHARGVVGDDQFIDGGSVEVQIDAVTRVELDLTVGDRHEAAAAIGQVQQDTVATRVAHDGVPHRSDHPDGRVVGGDIQPAAGVGDQVHQRRIQGLDVA